MSLQIIGRKERANLPEIGLKKLLAKIDTGAYTSSFHCYEIHREGEYLICKFNNPKNAEDSHKKVIFAAFKKKKVKSSNGISEERYVVSTEIMLGSEVFEIELTLTDRSDMKFPLLLGRKFLKNKFLVDVTKKYVLKK